MSVLPQSSVTAPTVTGAARPSLPLASSGQSACPEEPCALAHAARPRAAAEVAEAFRQPAVLALRLVLARARVRQYAGAAVPQRVEAERLVAAASRWPAALAQAAVGAARAARLFRVAQVVWRVVPAAAPWVAEAQAPERAALHRKALRVVACHVLLPCHVDPAAAPWVALVRLEEHAPRAERR